MAWFERPEEGYEIWKDEPVVIRHINGLDTIYLFSCTITWSKSWRRKMMVTDVEIKDLNGNLIDPFNKRVLWLTIWHKFFGKPPYA